MSKLEALSDIELHAKCLEYDMPNIPVTDSTRKILKRRLKAAMSGKPVTSAKKNRRESTIHVSRPSELSSSIEITGRNAIGISNTTPSKKGISRRTRAIQDQHVATSTTTSDPKYCDILPNSGAEPNVISAAKKLVMPTTYPKSPAKEPLLKLQRLSRTGVVATSFVQEHKSKYLDKTYGVPNDLGSAGKHYRWEKSERPTIAVSPVKIYESGSSYSDSPPSSSTCTNIRNTYGGPCSQLCRTAGTSQNINVYAKTDLDYKDQDIQAPFLSQFARRLETLKTSPLRYSVGPTKLTPPKSAALRERVKAPWGDNIAHRHSLTYGHMDDLPFYQCMIFLGEKYHLNQAFVIISIFIIAVFICVFFT